MCYQYELLEFVRGALYQTLLARLKNKGGLSLPCSILQFVQPRQIEGKGLAGFNSSRTPLIFCHFFKINLSLARLQKPQKQP